jgi:hypothetical protein
MIAETLSLLASMYDAIGPGIFFVLALPVFLAAFVVILRVGLKRPSGSAK